MAFSVNESFPCDVASPKKLWLLAAAACEGWCFSYLLGSRGLSESIPLLSVGWGQGWAGEAYRGFGA